MSSCPKCNHEINEGTTFCPSCGSTVKEVKCPKCRKKIEQGLSFCAACGCPANQAKENGSIPSQIASGCLKVFLLVFVLGLVIFFYFGFRELNTQRGLTLANYNRLEVGMSYDKAMSIVRPHSTRTSEVGGGAFHTVTYTVQGNGSRGSNAVLTFQGDPLRLTAKAQTGLR